MGRALGGMGGVPNGPAPANFGGGFLNLRDMIDGGGPGGYGNQFKGGPASGILNMLGVKPLGYNDRMSAAPAPVPGVPARAPARPAPAGPGPNAPITTSTLAPPGGRIGMTDLMGAGIGGAGFPSPTSSAGAGGAVRAPADTTAQGRPMAGGDQMNVMAALMERARMMVPQFDRLPSEVQQQILQRLQNGMTPGMMPSIMASRGR